MKKLAFTVITFFVLLSNCYSQWDSLYLGYPGICLDFKYLTPTSGVAMQSYSYTVGIEQQVEVFRILKTYNNGASWVLKYSLSSTGLSIYHSNFSFLDHDNGVFISDQTDVKLEKTSNGGDNWTSSFIPLTGGGVYPVSISYITENRIIALMHSSGYYLFSSTNAGISWSVDPLITPTKPNKIYFKNTDLGFIVADSGIIMRTTNLGKSWYSYNTGIPYQIYDIAFYDDLNGFAVGGGANACVIFKTKDGGDNWDLNYSQENTSVLKTVSIADQNVIYASGKKIFYSSTSGDVWHEQITMPGSFSYISAYNKDTVMCLASSNVYRTFSGGIVGIQPINSEVPVKFSLLQNYPNPFNPETKIKFQIQNPGVVKLEVFDMMGRIMKILVNEILQAGSYETHWNGSGYPSGFYFYRLTTSDFSETKKMILLK